MGVSGDIVLAIDQGTTGTTAVVLSASDANVVAKANYEFKQHFPHPGWVEHDLGEIWDSVERFERMQQLSSGSRASDPAAPAPPRHLPFSSSAWYSTCGALLSNARAVARLLRTGAGPERRGLRIACTLAFFNQMCASTSIIVYVQELAHLAGVTSSASRNLIASAVAASKLVGAVHRATLLQSAAG